MEIQAGRGDPAAMRMQVTKLRQSAESLLGLAERLDRRVETLVFDGPAAMHFRGVMRDRSRRARRAAEDLHESANRIQVEAQRVEHIDGRGAAGA